MLRRLELVLQDVSFCCHGLGFSIGTSHVSLQRGIARFELLQTTARPRRRFRGVGGSRRGPCDLREQRRREFVVVQRPGIGHLRLPDAWLPGAIATIRDPIRSLAFDLPRQETRLGHGGDHLCEACVGTFVIDCLFQDGCRFTAGILHSAVLCKVSDNPIANALISCHRTSLRAGATKQQVDPLQRSATCPALNFITCRRPFERAHMTGARRRENACSKRARTQQIPRLCECCVDRRIQRPIESCSLGTLTVYCDPATPSPGNPTRQPVALHKSRTTVWSGAAGGQEGR